jgi:putative transcriptional regulator
MSAPAHHPEEEVLLAYAGGALDEARGLLVATHLALCPLCRSEVARLEALGGAMLAQEPMAEIDDDLLDRIMSGLDDPPPAAEMSSPPSTAPLPSPLPSDEVAARAVLPEPLRSYVGMELERTPWQAGPLSWQVYPVIARAMGGEAYLARVPAGARAPGALIQRQATMLMLKGAVSYGGAAFQRGDILRIGRGGDPRRRAVFTFESVDAMAPSLWLCATAPPSL